ncbi:HEAT repeat domain-containing protein [candidate division KSB1 bacterium]|nr:HEAT repeat domain-containing protein [candidate division KSB1 bacterium]
MTARVNMKTRQIAQLSEDRQARRRALIELGRLKDPDLYELFLDALSDTNKGVQHAAIMALGRLGNPDAVSRLAKPKFLNADDLEIRLATVQALGKLGDAGVIDHLFARVDDKEWLVRNEALSVLRDKVESIVHNADPAQARVLVRMLAVSDPGITEIAVQGLIEMAPRIRQMLCDALQNVRPAIRCYAAQVLGQARIDAVPELIKALGDSEPLVRAEAARALGAIGHDSAIPHLIAALRDRHEQNRQTTAEALIRFGSRALPQLHGQVNHIKESPVKAALIDILGEIGDKSSMPILIHHLSDSCFVIRNAAVRALRRFGRAAADAVLPSLQITPLDISELMRIAQGAASEGDRLRAVRALGALEEHRSAELLKGLSQSENAKIAHAVQEALFRIGCAAWGRCGALIVIGETATGEWIDAIIPSLADDSPHVRYEAVRAVGRLNGVKAVARVQELALHDPVVPVRTQALKVLRELAAGSDDLLQSALEAIEDSETPVRLEATRILGDLVREEGLAPLTARLQDPMWSIRLSAENGLVNYGAAIVPQLLDLLKLDKSEALHRVISALGRLGDSAAIAPLEAITQNPKIRPKTLEITRQALVRLKKKHRQH